LINKVQQEKWFEQYCEDDAQIIFAIVDKDKNDIIGTIGLSPIDHFNQRAQLGTLIGNQKYWGKGYATEGLKLLLQYAFRELNLNRVYSYVFEENIASIKKNQKMGFKIEGSLRNHAYCNGVFKNVLVMGLLKKDFFPYE
jgi:diamine N-acetyltransferase